jgi:hypothetical protein
MTEKEFEEDDGGREMEKNKDLERQRCRKPLETQSAGVEVLISDVAYQKLT